MCGICGFVTPDANVAIDRCDVIKMRDVITHRGPDEEGLFIIVTENRNWYPTTKPALNAPVRVLFDSHGRDREASF